jgi:hypothetical protein
LKMHPLITLSKRKIKKCKMSRIKILRYRRKVRILRNLRKKRRKRIFTFLKLSIQPFAMLTLRH